MSTKTITLAQDAYDLLSGMKEAHDSFSDVVRKLVRKRSITEFAGILNTEEGVRVEKVVQQGRKNSKERAKHLQELLS